MNRFTQQFKISFYVLFIVPSKNTTKLHDGIPFIDTDDYCQESLRQPISQPVSAESFHGEL